MLTYVLLELLSIKALSNAACWAYDDRFSRRLVPINLQACSDKARDFTTSCGYEFWGLGEFPHCGSHRGKSSKYQKKLQKHVTHVAIIRVLQSTRTAINVKRQCSALALQQVTNMQKHSQRQVCGKIAIRNNNHNKYNKHVRSYAL